MPNGAFEAAENLFQNSTGEHEFERLHLERTMRRFNILLAM
jgi:hypothetical protein